MKQDSIFIYYWHIDEKEEEITKIRAYGIDKNNKNICLLIDDFTPYVYLELPSYTEWTERKAQLLGNKLDEELREFGPIKKSLIMKHKLYGAHINKDGSKKKFPYFFCSFAHKTHINKYLIPKLRRSLNVQNVGHVKMKVHESDADPILQLICCRNIPSVGWIKFIGEEVPENDKVTLAQNEYKVSWKGLHKIEDNTVGLPLIMGFDIEVNSSNPTAMPKAKNPGDKVFQISCLFNREGSKEIEYYLLTLGEADIDQVGENIKVICYNTESKLLIGFTDLVREKNPNVIVGYNILGFDIEYMINRAKFNFCISSFDKLGFHSIYHSQEKKIKWSSSAYKNQEFSYLECEGRIIVDLLPLIQRDYKFNNYTLKTVSQEILKDDEKIDLAISKMFKLYKIGTQVGKDGMYSKKSIKAMSIIGKYCIKDSELCVKLMQKMQTWIGLTEMASTCNTGIFSLYTQGQQIKVYSQVYRYCLKNNIVVEKDGYITKEGERYAGAHVFPPVPGIYDRVLPFDFCLSGDTLVTLSNGTSKRIDMLYDDQLVLGFNKDTNSYENFSSINGLQKKGIRDTIKIYFQDGSSIISTPDHKFMLENGEWCQAKDLKKKWIKAGIKFPEDKICDLEKEWKLEVEDYVLNMKNREERDKSLAFARMVGYILSDGSIYESTCKRGYIRKCTEACFGTMFDALTFKRDINLFSEVDVTIRKRDGNGNGNGNGNKEREAKGTTLSITIPANLSKMFHSLEDIIVGKRATQEMKFPKFILDNKCPLSIIREFLGGLFGGDGVTSSLTKKDRLTNISFKWTTIKNFIKPTKEVFLNIQNMLYKFNIKSSINNPIKVKYDNLNIKPKDYKENPRYDINLIIFIDSTYNFMDHVGFKYCINKFSKSYFSAMYLKMKENTRNQRIRILDRTNELIYINIKDVFSHKKNQMAFNDCLEIARKELLQEEPALYKISLSSTFDLTYDRHERIRNSDKPRKYSLHKKKFPSPTEYFTYINVIEFFNKNYVIKTDDTNIPSFRQKVIDVRDHEPTEVFDIEVENVHNFLANGITVSNCSLYPTT